MKPRFFPIIGERSALQSVPWAMVEAHEAQCVKNHGQTVRRLAERGGLNTTELWCALNDIDLRVVLGMPESSRATMDRAIAGRVYEHLLKVEKDGL